jgi:signal transduction histidine kinase
MAQRAAIADVLRSEFLETMNHEIRNPLGGVMAATDFGMCDSRAMWFVELWQASLPIGQ